MSRITSRLAVWAPASKTEDAGNLCMCKVIRKRRTKGEVILMLKGEGGTKKEKG